MEERRKYPRFEATLQVRYHPPANDAQFGYTITKDVCRGGLCMPVLSAIAKAGGIVHMDINRHGGEGKIPATGRIRWTRKLKRKAILDEEAGIEFTDIAPADIDRLVGTL